MMIEIPIERREPVMRWIPCSEKLPKVGQSVLLSALEKFVGEGCLKANGEWRQYRWSATHNHDVVTAWMPLPEPYKEGE